MLTAILAFMSVPAACTFHSEDAFAYVDSDGTSLLQRTRMPLRLLDDMPKIIHQSWKTSDLPAAFQTWSNTWKDCLPDWEYKLHTDQDNREIFKKHFPDLLDTYDGYPHPIMRADAARLAYLAVEGGLYVDLDIECLRDPREAMNHSASFVLACEGCNQISNAFMMASRSSMDFFKDLAYKLPESKDEGVLNATGPLFWSNHAPAMFSGDWITRPSGSNDLSYTRGGLTRKGIIMDGSLVFGAAWDDNDAKQNSLNRDWIQARYPKSFSYSHWTGSWLGYKVPNVIKPSFVSGGEFIRNNDSSVELTSNNDDSSADSLMGYYSERGVCQCVFDVITGSVPDMTCAAHVKNRLSIMENCAGRACAQKLMFEFREYCI